MYPRKPWGDRDPTREDAEAIGVQLASLVAAEVISQPVRGTVTSFIKMAIDLDNRDVKVDGEDLYEVLWNIFIVTFQQLMDLSPEGMRARASMAKELMIDAAEARKQAANKSIEAVKVKDVTQAPLIEYNIRSANESLAAANKLFDPVETNINSLVDTAKSLELVGAIQRKVRDQEQDEEHDCNCDNPDCTGHTNH